MMTSILANYEHGLAFLLACCAKATVVIATAWVIVVALRRRSSAIRHHIWAASILAALGLPLFALLLPVWRSAALSSAAAFWSPAHAIAASPGSHTIPPTAIRVTSGFPLLNSLAAAALIAWTLGFLFVLLKLVAGLARLAWLSSRATPVFEECWMGLVLELSAVHKISRSVRILQRGTPNAMPLTWGLFRPVIVLPSTAAQWPEDRRRVVLSHELAHIARHDWLLQICAEFARAIYWFHPLVWLAVVRLRQESERACDDAVLLSGVTPSQYASELLDLARTLKNSGRAWSTALAIARPSNLERRFAAMLNPSVNRRRLSSKARVLIPLFALCFVLPIAALRLPAQNLAGKTSGSIHDPSGGGILNATIVMSNHDTNTIDMTTTDREGNFSFAGLPAGKYELQVYKPGFQTYRQANVSLDAGREFAANFTLEVGGITDQVMVVPEDSEKPVVTEKTNGKPSRLRLGGNVEAAKLVKKVQPVYPGSAKSAGVQGTVVLHAVIGTDGKTLSLRVMNSQIDPELARSAVEAVSQWLYTPTLLNGEPIEVDTTITVNYSLETSAQ